MPEGESTFQREMEVRDGVRIVRISGRARGALAESPLNRRDLEQWLASGERQFVFDLSGLHFLDSSSLGDILACQKVAHATGGAVRVVLSSAQRKLFRAVKLDTLVEIFGDETTAVEAALAQLGD